MYLPQKWLTQDEVLVQEELLALELLAKEVHCTSLWRSTSSRSTNTSFRPQRDLLAQDILVLVQVEVLIKKVLAKEKEHVLSYEKVLMQEVLAKNKY